MTAAADVIVPNAPLTLELPDTLDVRPIDPNVLQRSASDPECSVWVGASAGTGKTKVLTDRVLRLMLAGTSPHRILCLTFTKAAAAEMANRINFTLAKWATISDAALEDSLTELSGARPTPAMLVKARRLFAQVIDCPGGMKIQTIHAFCQSLLRRFPLEANLPPRFEVMDERTADELLDEARASVLRHARAHPDTPLGHALARLTRDVGQEEFAEVLKLLTTERGRIRRILTQHGGLEGTIATVAAHLGVPPGADDSTILATICKDPRFDDPLLRRACEALAAGNENDQERGRAIRAWLDAAEQRIAGFTAFSKIFLTEKGEVRKTLITKKPADACPGAKDTLETTGAHLVEALNRVRSAGVAGATAALLRLGEELLEAYERLKYERSRLDYDDLILRSLDLMADPGSAWVMYKLDGGLDHLLIDEAQDTNPEQWQVVAALAESFFNDTGAGPRTTARTLFAVGDEKQSIYSFQRADPAEFARMREHFKTHIMAAGARWAKVDLQISFRSTSAVLSAVDAVFEREAARDGVAFDAGTRIKHIPFRRGHAGMVELWPAVAPDEKALPAPWEPPVARERVTAPSSRLANAIAATIAGWLERGEILEARGRKIQPGDVMVLVRRRTRFVEELVRACKERNVPIAGVDRMVLTQQISIMDLIALANFLLLPDDDLTLATVLKGPLVGLSEEQLFEVAHERKGRLWSALAHHAAVSGGDFDRAFKWLKQLLGQTDFTPPFEMFARVLSSPCPAAPGPGGSGRRAMLARLGLEAQDPLDEFLTASLTFERDHTPTLQGFMHWLEASEAEIKRELDAERSEDGGKVRIMTVHGSKGLQAPIVFMPDTMGTPVQGPRVLWPDEGLPVPLFAAKRTLEDATCAKARGRADERRDQEYRRLLYVALTRAEDRLYVCGWQTQKKPPADCWYNFVQDALADSATPTVFDFEALCPGSGWTGEGLRLVMRQQVPPKPDGHGEAKAAVTHAMPDWLLMPAPEEPTPSRPLTPSRPDDPEPGSRALAPKGQQQVWQRGTLTHRLLQTLPDLDDAAREGAAMRFLSRRAHKLTPAQQAEIARETLTVIRNPAYARLFGPNSRAEAPVIGIVSDDRVLSGQVDRLLVEDDAVWIVDYKTNRAAPKREEDVSVAYLKQMAAYRLALRGVYPGRDVRCFLLWTDDCRMMPLSTAILDRNEP